MKYFLPKPWKHLAQIRAVVFEINGKTALLRCTTISKNDVTVSKATLKISQGQFQQPFASLMTCFRKILFSLLELTDLLHLIENTFDRKRIYANPSSDPNPKAQYCFRNDQMTSIFDQVYRYRNWPLLVSNVAFGSMASYFRNWSASELSGFSHFMVLKTHVHYSLLYRWL